VGGGERRCVSLCVVIGQSEAAGWGVTMM